jgi:hypothetical protein
MMWRPFWALIERELMRMVRARRLVSAVRPLIWLLVTAFELRCYPAGWLAWYPFSVPGLLGMVMLFGAMLVSLSVVGLELAQPADVAPFPYWVVLAKTSAPPGGAGKAVFAVAGHQGYVGGGACSSCCSSAW